uniref:Uncharacterized protein n=1 Tax=Oryza punctata TaxID=4537 RepID=A0A0E0MLF3_ORYPU
MTGDDSSRSSKANLKPALVILYSLALFQGVLFYYKAISALEEQRLPNKVADEYGFDDVSCGSVLDYLREIRVGCEKDPSFARGRNLITYAAQQMKSTSPDRCLSGRRILDTLIRFNWRASRSELPGQVQMLDSKSPYDREIRLRAARIVDHFSSEIRLDKIMLGIQCISSLLDVEPYQQDEPLRPLQDGHHISFQQEDDNQLLFQEHEEQRNHSHKQLQLTGIQIISKLSNNENNLRIMSNTDDLALKIVSLIYTKRYELKDHDNWSRLIAEPGVKLISRFIKGPQFENLAGEELAQLSLGSKTSATIILKKYGLIIVNCVTGTHPGFYSTAHRKIAADIVKHLYSHYRADDEHFENRKEAMIDMIRKAAKPRMAFADLIKEADRVAAETIHCPLFMGHSSEEDPNSCCIG